MGPEVVILDILQNVMDASSHGMFTMDRNGRVMHINHQAKERFGLFNRSSQSHPAGKLVAGDLVAIATTAVGEDDGNLTPADLRRLGIDPGKVRPGDRVVAVGIFNEPAYKPVYKVLRHGEGGALRLDTVYQGIPVKVSVEPGIVSVRVWNSTYSLRYFRSICQMVVIGRNSRRVRFWEENGYSARREGIGNLLRGGSFVAKSPDTELVVAGYHFRDFFEGRLFEEHVRQVLEGEAEKYEHQEYEINGFALTASILPIQSGHGQPEGVIVKFRSIADIRTTIMERNAAIQSAERQFRQADDPFHRGDNAFSSLFGSGSTMAAAKQYASKLARLDCTILITGESGTGKTELANAIRRLQPRQGPFLTIDCAALDQDRADQTLFGGPDAVFRRASGGTVVLEEVGELPLSVQLQLVEFLRDKMFCPPDSGEAIQADVRVFATSSQDLKELVNEGRFRADLYYRLSAFRVDLPPLRNCRGDIPLLVNDLMEQIRRRYDMPEKYLSGEAFSQLLSYDWPGNIREMESVLERAVTLSESDIVYPEHIWQESPVPQATLRQQLKYAERRILEQALLQCGGDKQRAMKLLDVSRTTFYDKLKEYHLT